MAQWRRNRRSKGYAYVTGNIRIAWPLSTLGRIPVTLTCALGSGTYINGAQSLTTPAKGTLT